MIETPTESTDDSAYGFTTSSGEATAVLTGDLEEAPQPIMPLPPRLLKLLKRLKIRNVELAKRKIKNRARNKMARASTSKNRLLKYGR